jgi:DNA-binding NtrC family response regulator
VQRALKKKPVIRTNPTQSTTLRAAAAGLGGTLGAVASVFTAIGQLAPLAQAVLILGATVAVAAFAYIARERLRKWAAGDR